CALAGSGVGGGYSQSVTHAPARGTIGVDPGPDGRPDDRMVVWADMGPPSGRTSHSRHLPGARWAAVPSPAEPSSGSHAPGLRGRSCRSDCAVTLELLPTGGRGRAGSDLCSRRPEPDRGRGAQRSTPSWTTA